MENAHIVDAEQVMTYICSSFRKKRQRQVYIVGCMVCHNYYCMCVTVFLKISLWMQHLRSLAALC